MTADETKQGIPDTFERALELHRRGRIAEARRAFEAVVAGDPRHVGALHFAGVLAGQSGDLTAALEFFERAIAVQPNNASLHADRAFALRLLRRWEAAIESYGRAIIENPTYVTARLNRAALLEQQGDHAAALADYETALRITPNLPAAYHGRGNVRRMRGDLSAALLDYERALSLDPALVAAHLNRGAALLKLGRYESALVSLQRAIDLNPKDAAAHLNRGRALLELKRPDEALASFHTALDLDPSLVAARVNAGVLYGERLDFDTALRLYDEAIALSPDDVEARYNRATASLLLGDYELGWSEYEWRWAFTRTSPKIVGGRTLSQPLWLGSESLVGRKILLHWEQGLGDTLQFCRYASVVAELGAEVSLLVPAALTRLLHGIAGAERVTADLADVGHFDYHCPLMSLPLACGTRLDTVPAVNRYLQADPELVARWAAALGTPVRPRVGVTWSGRATQAGNRRRSIPLDQLLAALPAGIDYFCLQTEILPEDAATVATQRSIRPPPADFDLPQTAALCELLNAVVTVDTGIAHLAGALGRPTWILLPRLCDWRWLLERDDSPWYPTVRLYRQSAAGAWSGVLERIGADLAALSIPA